MYVVGFLYYILGVKAKFKRLAKTIRMREDVFHRAKVAAVISQKRLGQWVEEAILEKVHRKAMNTLPGSKGQMSPERSVEKHRGRQSEALRAQEGPPPPEAA